MDRRVVTAALLVCLAARAEGPDAEESGAEPPRSETPDAGPASPAVRGEGSSSWVHVGAMIGIVSLPRPIDVEILARFADLVGVGIGYSDFPAFVANPLLDLAGAKSGSIDARLDRFNAFDLDLRAFPFRGSFFLGSSFGRQSLKGAVTESTTLGPQTATVDLTTWYATPRLGWMWTFNSGFLLGFDLGVQFKLSADRTVTVPPSASADVRNKINNLTDLGASYPLPSLHLRVGWML